MTGARVHAYLHALQRVGQRARFVQQVRVLHVLRHPLQEAEWLVEGDGHGDLGQFLWQRRQQQKQQQGINSPLHNL